MLTLASFVLEKFGGDTLDDVRANLAHYQARVATAPDTPVAGGRRAQKTPADGIAFDSAVAEPVAPAGHGLTGTDEAGSGGDD